MLNSKSNTIIALLLTAGVISLSFANAQFYQETPEDSEQTQTPLERSENHFEYLGNWNYRVTCNSCVVQINNTSYIIENQQTIQIDETSININFEDTDSFEEFYCSSNTISTNQMNEISKIPDYFEELDVYFWEKLTNTDYNTYSQIKDAFVENVRATNSWCIKQGYQQNYQFYRSFEEVVQDLVATIEAWLEMEQKDTTAISEEEKDEDETKDEDDDDEVDKEEEEDDDEVDKEEEEDKKEFYQTKYENRLKEYDDVILNTQRHLIELILWGEENIQNYIQEDNKLNNSGELSFNAWVEGWDTFELWWNVDYDFDQNIDNNNFAWDIGIEFDYASNIFEIEEFFVNTNYTTKFIDSETFVRFNELELSDSLFELEDVDEEEINEMKEYLWEYIKVEKESANQDFLRGFQDWLMDWIEGDFDTETLTLIIEELYNEPMLSVYEEAKTKGEDKFKLLYNKNLFDLVTKFENLDDSEFYEDFKGDLENNFLILEDKDNNNYELKNQEANMDFDEETTLILDDEWISYFYQPIHSGGGYWVEREQIGNIEFEDDYLEVNYPEYFELSWELGRTYKDLSGEFDIEGVKGDINITIEESSFDLEVDITEIPEQMLGMMVFVTWESVDIDSAFIDINATWEQTSIDEFEHSKPSNYINADEINEGTNF